MAVVLAPVVLVALAALWYAAAFAGGLDDLLGGGGPSETDPEVVAAREAGTRELRRDTAALLDTVVRPALPPGTRDAASTMISRCAVGQHNWKIDDPYDLDCSLEHRVVVTLTDAAAFVQHMLGLHESFVAAGWEQEGASGIPYVIENYWRNLAGTTMGTGTASSTYGVDDLPSAMYRRPGDPGSGISLSWTEPGARLDHLTGFASDVTFRGGGRDLDPEEVLRDIPPGGYAVVLSTGAEYFLA